MRSIDHIDLSRTVIFPAHSNVELAALLPIVSLIGGTKHGLEDTISVDDRSVLSSVRLSVNNITHAGIVRLRRKLVI